MLQAYNSWWSCFGFINKTPQCAWWQQDRKVGWQCSALLYMAENKALAGEGIFRASCQCISVIQSPDLAIKNNSWQHSWYCWHLYLTKKAQDIIIEFSLMKKTCEKLDRGKWSIAGFYWSLWHMSIHGARLMAAFLLAGLRINVNEPVKLVWGSD